MELETRLACAPRPLITRPPLRPSMQGPRSGEFTRALARARKGKGETRRRSTVVQRDARRLNVLAPAKEVQTLIPYRELRVVPLTKTLGEGS